MFLISGCLLHCYISLRHPDRAADPRLHVGRGRRRPLLPLRAQVRQTFRLHRLEEGRRADVLLAGNLLGWAHDVWLIQQVS